MLTTPRLRLFPSDPSLADMVADYYERNREFLKPFDPAREEEFFTVDYQRRELMRELNDAENRRAARFYIALSDEPHKIIGMAALSNIVWGAFCSAFLGYKLDHESLCRGYMTEAVGALTHHAFFELGLHRIEANIMPRNTASLRVAEKNGYRNEGLSRRYLSINGVWEDHIHMVRLSDD